MSSCEFHSTIELFLDSKKLDRGASQHTISAYKRDMFQFTSFLNTKNTPSEIELTDIQKFITHLHYQKQTASSIHRKMSVLRQFFKFCCLEQGLKNNPTEELVSPKQPKRLPKFLTPKEIEELLKIFDRGLHYKESTQKEALQTRDRALVTLLYATGLRVSEILGLNLNDIDFKLTYVKVLGKGGKERIVPFAKPALELLYHYVTVHRPKLSPKDESVFVNHHGARLSRQGFFLFLKEAALQAEIKIPLSPHVLRHSFASHLLQGGIPLRSLQILLGHSDLSTTQIYTHLQPEHLQNAIERFHPRAHVRNKKIP